MGKAGRTVKATPEVLDFREANFPDIRRCGIRERETLM
jgi:hypothetical protein